MELQIDNEFIRSIYSSSMANTSLTWSGDIPSNRVQGIAYALEVLNRLAADEKEKPLASQAIASRLFNLGSSSFLLLNSAYYDESRTMLRSIGEISNLLCLFTKYPSEFEKWSSCSKEARSSSYHPDAVRKKLTAIGEEIPATFEWYSSLCDELNNLTPSVFPVERAINAETTAIAGARYDEQLYKLVSYELWLQLSYCVIYLSHFHGLSDELGKSIENIVLELGQYQQELKTG